MIHCEILQQPLGASIRASIGTGIGTATPFKLANIYGRFEFQLLIEVKRLPIYTLYIFPRYDFTPTNCSWALCAIYYVLDNKCGPGI